MNKKIIWIIGIVVAAALAYNMVSRKKAEEKAITDKVAEEGVAGLEQKLLSFTIDGRSPKGVRQWHLEGNSAEMVDDAIHLKDLKAVAYGDDGTEVNLTSDRGIYNKDKGEVELMGNVRAISDDGTVLLTESAKWSQRTKDILSDAYVEVRREGMIATGTGALANSDQKKAALLKDVTVDIEPDTKVQCVGSLNISYDENIAVFHEDVMVEDKDGKMYADMLTVHLDPETQKLAKVVAEGNVKVKRGQSYTISEKAIYTETTKSAQLLGNPRVVIAPEEIEELQRRERGEILESEPVASGETEAKKEEEIIDNVPQVN